MAVIGKFKLNKAGGWEGDVRTLLLNAHIRLVPNEERRSETSPAFRVMLGWSRIGDAWETEIGGPPPKHFWSLKLDDPAFPTPMRAILVPDADGLSATMMWERPRSP